MTKPQNYTQTKKLANALRVLAAHMPSYAKSGHPGLPLGMADVVTVLFQDFFKFYPHDSTWFNRDRFILSAGHGSALLYALLHLLGYDYSISDLQNFRQLDSKTPGHPEYNPKLGIETTTGPLGQGLANAIGIAIEEKHLHHTLPDAIDYHTVVLVSDGDLMEGLSHESLSLATQLNTNKLIVLYDQNHITIDGSTQLAQSYAEAERLKAYGFFTQEIDGHNMEDIAQALTLAYQSSKPSFIACHTTIGYGSPEAGTEKVHGNPLNESSLKTLNVSLGYENFNWDLPKDIIQTWEHFYRRCEQAYQESKTLELDYKILKDMAQSIVINPEWVPFSDKPLATRVSSKQVIQSYLEHHKGYNPILFGSADLQGSTGMDAEHLSDFTKDQDGSFIHYGIREHAMGGIMNGLALNNITRAVGSTFFVFSDYMKPAIRLAALMKLPNIYVFSHDSIGVGEDGPTHQPIEQLTMLRSIPNMVVLRPADQFETWAAWNVALQHHHAPIALILTRQALPNIKSLEKQSLESLQQLKEDVSSGAYFLQKQPNANHTLIASGSEVHLILEAAHQLHHQGIPVNVVSMPSLSLFLQHPKTWQDSILGTKQRFFVEASLGIEYAQIMKPDDHFIGLQTFGKSGKKEDIFQYFHLTIDDIVQQVMTKQR